MEILIKKICKLTAFLVLAAFWSHPGAGYFITPAMAQESETKTDGTITDAEGKSFKTGQKYEKIISTAPAITEIIFYVGCADKLKAVTTFCDYPEEAKKIEKIGDLNLNYEKIIQIKPDIVFTMKGLRAKEAEVLESFGIKTFSLELNSIDSITQSIESVSKLLGAPKDSKKFRDALKNLHANIMKRNKKPLRSVYFETWGTPPMSVGKLSFINDIIKTAYGINIFNDSEIENISVSLEKVIEKNPEYIIVAYPGSTSEISMRPGFSNIIAVKDGNVITCDYNIFVRPGPRVVNGILELYNCLYSDKKINADEIFSK